MSAESLPGKAREESNLRRFLADYCASPLAVLGAVLLAAIILAALLAPWITPQNPFDLMQIDLFDGRLAPGTPASDGRFTYWLGTDDQGRDILSAIIHGLRISLGVGVVSAVVAGLIGTFLGLAAAYFGGRLDSFIMRIVDLQLSFPAVLVALMILTVLGKSVLNVILALVLVEWAFYARTARGSAVAEREKDYVQAAHGLALSNLRILLRHMLPNILSPLIVVMTIQVARAITLEATLSFLGLGVPLTQPSLGLLIANGYRYVMAGDYWITFYPGLALLLTIVAINLVGDQLRDVLNPRLQK